MTAAIKLDNVSKSLAGRQLLKDVSFSVEQGDVFGYLGPNGAGKTTTIRLMLGLLRPTAGTVQVAGRDASRDAAAKRKVGFVLEADGLYDNLNARENLAYYCDIYGAPGDRARQDSVLKQVGLLERAEDRVAIYSKGMRQRLALARAVIHEPEIMVLDEPTAGVDPTGQIETREIILGFARQGKTVLLSSHNLDEVQRICNRVAIIHKGEIRLCGEVAKLRQAGRREVAIRLTDMLAPEAGAALRRLSYVNALRAEDHMLLVDVTGRHDVSEVLSILLQSGAGIEEVRPREATLEEIYASIVGRETT